MKKYLIYVVGTMNGEFKEENQRTLEAAVQMGYYEMLKKSLEVSHSESIISIENTSYIDYPKDGDLYIFLGPIIPKYYLAKIKTEKFISQTNTVDYLIVGLEKEEVMNFYFPGRSGVITSTSCSDFVVSNILIDFVTKKSNQKKMKQMEDANTENTTQEKTLDDFSEFLKSIGYAPLKDKNDEKEVHVFKPTINALEILSILNKVLR